jgi:hypothetical protein
MKQKKSMRQKIDAMIKADAKLGILAPARMGTINAWTHAIEAIEERIKKIEDRIAKLESDTTKPSIGLAKLIFGNETPFNILGSDPLIDRIKKLEDDKVSDSQAVSDLITLSREIARCSVPRWFMRPFFRKGKLPNALSVRNSTPTSVGTLS